jgi:UPF0716 protein FxsA
VLFVLIAIFIVVPLLELWVIIQIGGSIGVVPTLLLLLIDGFLGALLLRSQGRASWVGFNRALAESRVPANEILDGVLIIFGGALLLTPGFITDIFGLVLLIPPTRAIVRGVMKRFAIGRFTAGPRGAMWGYGQAGGRRGSSAPNGSEYAGSRPGSPPRRDRAAEDFSWTTPEPAGPRPDDIEGTAQEVDGEDALPPGDGGRGSFPG